MTREEKYRQCKEMFDHYFICKGVGRSTNIPLCAVNFDSEAGDVGDGTINLALYLQYLHTCVLLGEAKESDIDQALLTLQRLMTTCRSIFVNKFPNVYMPEEYGFFLRDDIMSSDAPNFNLKSVRSGYSTGIERIDEDPCFSPFTSQDQIWNLLPILAKLDECYSNKAPRVLINSMLEYVIRNKHVIYNPYYSALKHNWTYLNLDIPYEYRIAERNKKLKYDIKVKRGANNWYFSYGFRKTYNEFGGDCKTFWHSLWYKPFIFLADRVYHPYICKWFNLPVKQTSYYSLAVAGGAWYNKKYEKRILKRFDKSLEEAVKGKGSLFLPELACLIKDRKNININLLGKWLDNFEVPKYIGRVESPLLFMTLYNWCRIIKKENAEI